MAENNETSTESPRVETEVARPQVSSVTLGREGAEAVTHDELSNSLDLGAEPEGDDEDVAAEGSEDAEAETDGEGTASEESDLPEYDPESDEVRAKYDERYFKDGELNREAVSTEFWKSFEKAKGDLSKAGLNESTYAYLKDTLGVSKEMAKEIEAGLVAKHAAEEATFFNKFGGVDRYNRAIAWAKDGGYSEEQQQRFRDAYARGGADRDDAVDALMNRFHRASPPPKGPRRGPPGGRSSSPQRDVTSSSANRGPSGDRFANSSEHRKAWDAGLAAKRAAQDAGDRAAVKQAEEALSAIHKKARRGYAR